MRGSPSAGTLLEVILVDSPIWIDHLRRFERAFAELIAREHVVMHPHILGELHVRRLIEASRLYATGIGYIDAHLLASTTLLPGAKLWTRDKRLHQHADRLASGHTPSTLMRLTRNKLASSSH